jgi:hypothetical protein
MFLNQTGRETSVNTRLICTIGGSVGIGLASASFAAQAHDAIFYPRDTVVFGGTYADWSAAWRQWADSLPAKHHPLFDTADCNKGQSGPVFFLGGRFCAPDINPSCENAPAERSCTVPNGKALYFPVLNTSCLDGEAKNGLCLKAGPIVTEMRSQLAAIINKTTGLQVTVDGQPLTVDLKRDFRVQSAVYPSILPEGNLYQALGEPQIGPGNYLGVDDGIYVMLKPLKKGAHTLNFKGKFTDPFVFDLDFTYKLNVK